MKLTSHKLQKGFTLIELLVVIGILAVLLAIVLIAINPARQFSQANDTKRRSDINALLNAVHQYAADERGDISLLLIGQDSTDIAFAGGTHETGSAFCTELVTEYIAALPSDPTLGTGLAADGAAIMDASCAAGGWDTGYQILQSADDNRITVSASGELVTEVSVTR